MKKIYKHELGEPWKPKDSAIVIVPVLQKEGISERNYKLAEETELGFADSGSIKQVIVENEEEKHIFLRNGTLLKGQGTQSRATQYGITIPSGEKAEIPVKCVHASHPISNGSRLMMAGNSGSKKLEQSLRNGDQHQVWATVSTLATSNEQVYEGTTTDTSTDNYIKYREEKKRKNESFKDRVNEILQEMPQRENQIGIVIVGISGVIGVEAFDHPDSWEALKESVLEKYGEDIQENAVSDMFEPNMEKVRKMVDDFLKNIPKTERETVYENEVSKTEKINHDEFTGEFNYIEGKLVHFVASKKEKEEKKSNESNPIGVRNLPERPETNWDDTTTYFTRKDSTNILEQVRESPKTWSEIKSDTSTRTKAKRLKEAQSAGLIEKKERANGKESYFATEKGKAFIE